MIDSIKIGLDLSAKKALIESTLGTAGFSGCLLAYSLFVMARTRGLRGRCLYCVRGGCAGLERRWTDWQIDWFMVWVA